MIGDCGNTALGDRSTPLYKPTPVDRLDPRGRIVAAVVFSIVAAVAGRFETLAVALAAALAATLLARLAPRAVVRRLVPLNLFMAMVVLLLPLSTAGQPLVRLGPLAYTAEGLRLAIQIALKGNAIVLMLVALWSTMDLNTVGHALAHLRVPEKLIHLMLLSVRYLDVLRGEYRRLVGAMRMRGFRPAANRHTYRSYGYLLGMLLVRGLDRAERILAAMKCRGFRGRFYLLDHFAFSPADAWFSLVGLAVLSAMFWMECK